MAGSGSSDEGVLEVSWPGGVRAVPLSRASLTIEPVGGTTAPPPRRVYAIPFLVDAHCHLPVAGAPLESAGPGGRDPRDPLDRSSDARRLRTGFVERAREMGVARLAPWPDRPAWVASAIRGLTGSAAAGHIRRYARPIEPGDDPARLVDENVAAGASLVKVIATGSGLAPEPEAIRPVIETATFHEVARAAAARGLPLAVHCHGGELVGAAIDAGVGSIEHGLFLRAAELGALRAAGIALTLTPGAYLHADPARLGPVLERLVEAALGSGVTVQVGTDGEEESMLGQLGALVACGMPLGDAIAAAADGWTGAGEVAAEFDRSLVIFDADPARHPGALAAPGWVAQPRGTGG